MRARPVFRLVPLAALASALLTACVTDGPPTAQSPPPLPPPSSDVQPVAIDLSASRFAQDSDKNGYADSITLSVFLFNIEKYPASLAAHGRFVFELLDESGKRLCDWSMSDAQVEAARRDLLPGPGYAFRISMRDCGSDEIEKTDAQLNCMYIPAAGGTPLRSANPVRVSVGQIR